MGCLVRQLFESLAHAAKGTIKAQQSHSLASNEAFYVVNCSLRVAGRLVFSGITDEAFFLGESNI